MIEMKLNKPIKRYNSLIKFLCIVHCALCMLMVLAPSALAVRPDNIKKPKLQSDNSYVANPDNVLSEQAVGRINTMLRQLEDSTSVQVAVAVVKTIDDADDTDYAQELFELWKPGYADRDNGVLLLIATDDRVARIHTGYGAEGALPDIEARRILTDKFVPLYHAGNTDGAVEATVSEMTNVLMKPEYRGELMSNRRVMERDRQMQENREALITLLFWVVGALTLLASALLISTVVKGRKMDRYHRALAMKSTVRALWWLSAITLGCALPIALIGRWLLTRYRNKPEICGNCGSKMKKLSETEDNAKLTPAQDFEEQLNSVDYDVWLCPTCNSTAVYAYRNDSSTYKECPSCHTMAYRQTADRVLRQPTTRIEGLGEKVSECRYCKYRHSDPYVIPKAAAPVIIAGGGGHGGGGGFGGGGFGGGMSGGGGASVRF